PQFIMDMLKEYKEEQDAEALRLGDRWDGRPMQNGTPYFWLGEFCEKHDLPFYGLHSFRHLFCSLLVNQGVDIVTVSGALGHSCISTTIPVSNSNTKPTQYLPTRIIIIIQNKGNTLQLKGIALVFLYKKPVQLSPARLGLLSHNVSKCRIATFVP
ncbi:MAG: tyrosine-type recombinase/integrase, partial [Lachnospiraceae bacterium]|nr:tyrosine-type recombinase/integrase [Lachnospiraceae bacterium]